MKPQLKYLLISTLLYLPMSPILAIFGVSACPILRGYGFWQGCQFNLTVLLTVFFVTTTSGLLQLNSAFSDELRKYLGRGTTIVQGVFQIGISYLILFSGVSWLSQVLTDANSGKAAAVSWILAMIGSLAISLQAQYLDLLLIKNSRKSAEEGSIKVGTQEKLNEINTASKESNWITSSEFFLQTQQIITPLVVMFFFSQLTLEMWNSDVSGWKEQSDIALKARWMSALMFIWFVIFSYRHFSFKRFLTSALTQHARALTNADTKQLTSPERMGSLTETCLALNDSSQTLLHKNRLLSGFSKFVSDQVADRVIKQDGLEHFGHQVGCAILMSDLREFTKISENMKAQDVVRMLNIYFQDMIEVLSTHGVFVDKFIGDGLLAYVPLGDESGLDLKKSETEICERVFRAAVDMKEKLVLTNASLAKVNLPQLKLGVGIHFGQVVLGSMGSKDRMQYTIIGESVNKTARLEAACKDVGSEITLSGELFDRLPQESRDLCGKEIRLTLKGFAETHRIYGVSFDKASGPKPSWRIAS